MDYQLLTGDCRTLLDTLDAGSVQCCVCSPPYWGLRSYLPDGHEDKGLELGAEQTPDEYVANLVDVFRKVRRVLRDDGTVWLNLGDSYAGSWGNYGGQNRGNGTQRPIVNGSSVPNPAYDGLETFRPATANVPGLKPIDLCMIPARVALALQADGWWLRSDIIWHKPNPMPESVTDRPTKAHEYVFLLTKSASYYYDAEAVREDLAESTIADKRNGTGRHTQGLNGSKYFDGGSPDTAGADKPSWYRQKTFVNPVAGRNRRSVWTITTKPYAEAHFATYPPELPELCILAGTSAHGQCARCGAPWRRVVEHANDGTRQAGNERALAMGHSAHGMTAMLRAGEPRTAQTLGWQPSCTCGCAEDMEPDDFEIVATPTGERAGDDPTMLTGRRGMNRPRGDNEGQRPITRYEQRRYAAQLRNSPHRAVMESEAGGAFDHYIRTDRNGARPVPQDLLDDWIARGWLERVDMPQRVLPPVVPQTVLDPFAGSGTTLAVALSLGRRAVGIELNPTYTALAHKRITGTQPALFGIGA